MLNLTRQGVLAAVLDKLHAPQLYKGTRTEEGVEVLADERKLTPVLSQVVRNHSPDGFNWGYGGSGPAQLALALLIDVGLRHDLARQLYQDFKFRFVASWDRDEWTLAGAELLAWIGAALGELAAGQRATGVVEADDDP